MTPGDKTGRRFIAVGRESAPRVMTAGSGGASPPLCIPITFRDGFMAAVPAAKKPLPPGVPADGPGAPAALPDTTPPAFGTPKPADPSLAGLPRVCNELERSRPGQRRYKIRAENYSGMNNPRYILAADGDEEGARACYLEASGIAAHLAKLKKNGRTVTEIETPFLAITVLPD